VTVCGTDIFTVLDIETATSEDPQCTSEELSLKDFELKSHLNCSEIRNWRLL